MSGRDCEKFKRDRCNQDRCSRFLTCEILWGGTFPEEEKADEETNLPLA